MTDELQFMQTGDTGVITFNRPEARNALTFDMYESLATFCESVLDKSLAIRSLIITGAGDKAFAAGTDIAAFRDFRSEEDALGYERRMDRVLGLLESLPIPTIAAIRGACPGAVRQSLPVAVYLSPVTISCLAFRLPARWVTVSRLVICDAL